MTTEERLAKLQALEAMATPGPWRTKDGNIIWPSDDRIVAYQICGAINEELIIAMREAMPWLLELVDSLKSDYRDQIKELFSRLPRQSHWCPEWDDLLVLPSDEEFKACTCYAT